MQKQFSFMDIVLRIFAATAGGLLGVGIFLLVFLALKIPAKGAIDNMAFSNVSVLVISFCGVLSGSILGALLFTMASRESYSSKLPILRNIFISVFSFFLVSIPFLTLSEKKFEITGVLFIFSIMVSVLFLQFFRNDFSIGSIHGAFISGFFLILVFYKIFESGTSSIFILLFTLPFGWMIITFFSEIGGVLYSFLKKKNLL